MATKQSQSPIGIEARLLRPIFTVGYGGRHFIDFVSLLKRHDIAFVADIRRFPNSTVPQYSRENLEAKLPEFGIGYVSMAHTLGAFRRGGYPKHVGADLYKTGMDELLRLAERGNVVPMCKERRDASCHRRYIMETLAERGIRTIPLV